MKYPMVARAPEERSTPVIIKGRAGPLPGRVLGQADQPNPSETAAGNAPAPPPQRATGTANRPITKQRTARPWPAGGAARTAPSMVNGRPHEPQRSASMSELSPQRGHSMPGEPSSRVTIRGARSPAAAYAWTGIRSPSTCPGSTSPTGVPQPRPGRGTSNCAPQLGHRPVCPIIDLSASSGDSHRPHRTVKRSGAAVCSSLCRSCRLMVLIPVIVCRCPCRSSVGQTAPETPPRFAARASSGGLLIDFLLRRLTFVSLRGGGLISIAGARPAGGAVLRAGAGPRHRRGGRHAGSRWPRRSAARPPTPRPG